MLDKIKELREKVAFLIGLSLIILSPVIFIFISFGIWMSFIIQGIIWAIAFLFILSASDKRHSWLGRDE